MRKILIAFACLLTACASNHPVTQRVNVPVVVPCLNQSQIPERPKYESYSIDLQANDGEKVLAITRDWLRSRRYEAKLEAIAKECSK